MKIIMHLRENIKRPLEDEKPSDVHGSTEIIL
jgi:hypothetical protein